MSLFQRKCLLFGFAVVAMNALLVATFALGRMSMWVVSHDAVNARMDKEGYLIEHVIAEIVFSRTGVGEWFIGALVCSIVFLILLWHTLFRAQAPNNSSYESASSEGSSGKD